MSYEKIITGIFAEKSTPKITSVIKDDTGTVIPGSSLDSLVLTLYDKLTGNLLGGRSAQQDIKNINGGVIDESGNFSLQLTALDMAIETDTLRTETHVALVEWKYSGSALGNKLNIIFNVANLAKVT